MLLHVLIISTCRRLLCIIFYIFAQTLIQTDSGLVTMIHIGKCIRKKIEEQGKTTVWFAQELGCHRTNIYKIYDKVTIDTGILLHISKILNYDFFSLYSEDLSKDS